MRVTMTDIPGPRRISDSVRSDVSPNDPVLRNAEAMPSGSSAAYDACGLDDATRSAVVGISWNLDSEWRGASAAAPVSLPQILIHGTTYGAVRRRVRRERAGRPEVRRAAPSWKA